MKRRVALAAGLAALALVFVPWTGPVRREERHSRLEGGPPLRFPPGFLWGVATAAHQVEGSHADDWSAFEHDVLRHRRFESLGPGRARAGHIRNLGAYAPEVVEQKTGYDALYDEDLARAAGLGVRSYRFSISWARLFPSEGRAEPDPAGIEYYRRVLASCRRHGLTPFVTLFHFSAPRWLFLGKDGRRGWERADALVEWERFVSAVAGAFGSEVRHWCTLNEPMVYLLLGYLDGLWPPLERRGGPQAVAPVLAQLLRAHAAAWRVLKEDAARRGQSNEVGLTQNAPAFVPYRNLWPFDRLTAAVLARLFIWDVPEALRSGRLRLTSTSVDETIPGLAGTQDYLGINYYSRSYVRSPWPGRFEVLPHDPELPGEPRNDLDWAYDPRGLSEVLREAHRRFGLPIYILENGTADAEADDVRRQRGLVAHLAEVWAAHAQGGAEVRGYFHWSLTDNFEWAEGFEGRFGLFAVDYTRDLARKPRGSAALYGLITRANAIEGDVWARYGPPGR